MSFCCNDPRCPRMEFSPLSKDGSAPEVVVKTLVSKMTAQPENVRTQLVSLQVLTELTERDGKSKNPQKFARVARDSNAPKAVVEAMQRHFRSRQVRTWGITALYSLAAFDEPCLNSCLLTCGAVDSLIQVMEGDADDAEIMASCCSTVTAFVRGEGKEDVMKKLVAAGACELATSALAAHGKSSLRLAIGAADVLTFLMRDREDAQLRCGKAGAIAALIYAMAAHPKDCDLQFYALETLRHLVNRKENRELGSSALRVYRQLAAAAEAFPDDINVAFLALSAIETLMKDVTVPAAGVPSVCAAVVSTIRGLSGSGQECFPNIRGEESTFEAACGVIRGLSNAFPASKGDMATMGCVEALLAFGVGKKECADCEKNAALVCRAIGCMSKHEPSIAARFLKERAATFLLQAMYAYQQSQRVVLGALRALLVLSDGAKNAPELRIATWFRVPWACEIVLYALSYFDRDVIVVWMALRVMRRMATLCGGRDHRSKFVDLGACQDVTKAMLTFPQERGLQLEACECLLRFAWTAADDWGCGASKARTIKALKMALVNHAADRSESARAFRAPAIAALAILEEEAPAASAGQLPPNASQNKKNGRGRNNVDMPVPAGGFLQQLTEVQQRALVNAPASVLEALAGPQHMQERLAYATAALQQQQQQQQQRRQPPEGKKKH